MNKELFEYARDLILPLELQEILNVDDDKSFLSYESYLEFEKIMGEEEDWF